jgi:hypothetical protein
MNGSVQHHGPSDGHDSSNGSFGVSIVMMGTSSCESDVLAEILEVQFECM